MYPVFESIAVINGAYQNLDAHNRRIYRTAQALWQQKKPLQFLETCLPEPPKEGVFKCRFLYNATEHHTLFKPYTSRKLSRLILVEATDLLYDYKYTNRAGIDKHTHALLSNQDVILTQHGFIRDTSYANIACSRNGEWFTPETPLLQGTRRELGIRSGKLIPVPIHINDLRYFETITWFNAMLPIGEQCLSIEAIDFKQIT